MLALLMATTSAMFVLQWHPEINGSPPKKSRKKMTKILAYLWVLIRNVAWYVPDSKPKINQLLCHLHILEAQFGDIWRANTWTQEPSTQPSTVLLSPVNRTIIGPNVTWIRTIPTALPQFWNGSDSCWLKQITHVTLYKSTVLNLNLGRSMLT